MPQVEGRLEWVCSTFFGWVGSIYWVDREYLCGCLGSIYWMEVCVQQAPHAKTKSTKALWTFISTTDCHIIFQSSYSTMIFQNELFFDCSIKFEELKLNAILEFLSYYVYRSFIFTKESENLVSRSFFEQLTSNCLLFL